LLFLLVRQLLEAGQVVLVEVLLGWAVAALTADAVADEEAFAGLALGGVGRVTLQAQATRGGGHLVGVGLAVIKVVDDAARAIVLKHGVRPGVLVPGGPGAVLAPRFALGPVEMMAGHRGTRGHAEELGRLCSLGRWDGL